MPPVKLQRVEYAEVRRRWLALSLERRREATCFEDAALVRCIRDAVQSLFQKQVMMAKLGMRAAEAPEPDLYLDSAFFKDVFHLQWIVEKSEEYKDAVLMNPEIQPALLTLRPPMLEECVIFDRLQRTLPDFLAAKTGRFPMPRARWKQLWATEPPSVSALEQQLAKLMEQALWSMGSNPAFDVREAGSDPAAMDEVSVSDKDWMESATQSAFEKAASKPKKKKKVKRRSQGCHDQRRPTAPAEEEPSENDDRDEELENDHMSDKMKEALAGGTASESSELPAAAHEDPSGFSDVSAAVQHHYWDWHADLERRPMFSWCLPQNPWSRGYWSRRHKESPAPVQTSDTAVVRNTFIDVIEDGNIPPSRTYRSLSPTRSTQREA